MYIYFLFFIIFTSLFESTILGNFNIRTLLIPETQGQFLPTQYFKFVNLYNENNKCFNYDFNITYRYNQSNNSSEIASILWGNNELLFQGALVQGRNSNALIAEYFGLSPDTNTSLFISPKITNSIIDLQLAIGKNKFWAQINIPINNTKNNLPYYQTGAVGLTTLDGTTIALSNNQLNNPSVNNPCIATLNDLPITSNYNPAYQNNGSFNNSGYFISPESSYTEPTFVSIAQLNRNTGNDNDFNILTNSTLIPIDPHTIGTVNIGNYGTMTSSSEITIATPNLNLSTSTVLAANSLLEGLSGYTFGKLKKRKYNLFNFNNTGEEKIGIADIPIMIGYNLFENIKNHLSAYLKIVFPTGTKIDSQFLETVFRPVIGNGRFFEIGGGISFHTNIFNCDYSITLYGDSYMTKMYSNGNQLRSFDLFNQPMSRYTLVYPIKNANNLYTVDQNLLVAGDINLFNGPIESFRGEGVLDLVINFDSFKYGIGYSLSGRAEDSINKCTENIKNNKKMFGIASNVLQYAFGVGPIANLNGIKNYPSLPCGEIMAGGTEGTQNNLNFIYLGQTDNVAYIPTDCSSAYEYGVALPALLANFTLPELDNNSSGLIQAQIINRIFLHLDYNKEYKNINWYASLFLSRDFTTNSYPSPCFNNIAFKLGYFF